MECRRTKTEPISQSQRGKTKIKTKVIADYFPHSLENGSIITKIIAIIIAAEESCRKLP